MDRDRVQVQNKNKTAKERNLASHAGVFRGLVLWGGGNTSPLKTTAWEAKRNLASIQPS